MTTPILPPHSLETEESVLGSVIIDPSCLLELSQFLKPAMFYRSAHGSVYAAMLSLHSKKEPIDFVTLSDILRRRNLLDEIGGEGAIVSFINAVPTALNAVTYGRIVEATYLARQMLTAASDIAKLAYNETLPIEERLKRSTELMFGLNNGRATNNVQHISQIANDYLQFIDQKRDDPTPTCIPTGYPDIDKLLGGGMQRGELILLPARPSMGKSALSLGMAHNAAKMSHRTFSAQLEMDGRSNLLRLLAGEIGLEHSTLRGGIIPHAFEAPLFESIGRISQLPLWIDDSSYLSISDIETRCQHHAMSHGLDLIVIDYGQMIDAPGRDEVQKLTAVGRRLKALARDLDVPILVPCQLSRAVEQRQDKRPHLSDIRGSGCLAGDTLITIANTGQRIPIRDLVGCFDFSVLALNEQTLKIEAATVSKAFPTGTRPVFRLITQLGRTIRSTANHKFRTFDGWKRLDEITADDFLALPRNVASDLYWDKVVSITPCGKEEVFDLTVPGPHNFIANDIVVHNSLEQDADVVAFIYRDDYYFPDTTDRPNVAEINVAKQRNGATGVVDLFWDAKTTTFRNLHRQNINLSSPSAWDNKAGYDAAYMDL